MPARTMIRVCGHGFHPETVVFLMLKRAAFQFKSQQFSLLAEKPVNDEQANINTLTLLTINSQLSTFTKRGAKSFFDTMIVTSCLTRAA